MPILLCSFGFRHAYSIFVLFYKSIITMLAITTQTLSSTPNREKNCATTSTDNSSPFVPPHIISRQSGRCVGDRHSTTIFGENQTNNNKRVGRCQSDGTTCTKNKKSKKSNNKGDKAEPLQKYCQKHWKKLLRDKFKQPFEPWTVGGPSLLECVQKMKAKTIGDPKVAKQLMIDANTLLEKCILNRERNSPNSDVFEKVIKHDLQLENAPDKMSGDASKNGFNIEIKCSTHAKHSTFNFVQIRPDHNVHFYLFVGYNLWHADGQADALGKEYLFKIPSEDLYNMVVEHGGYAHGSKMVLPAITLATMKGNGYEYALRVNPNAGKRVLWNKLLKYKVEYNPNIFKKSGAKQIDAKQIDAKQKEDQQIEDDLDWFLQELANEIKTRIEV